eukprot:Hpha_TRINITY_DN23216_c0_g1::TRINITY_DN23216_c0_g1_i1::g.30225::m.30225
MRWQGGGGRGKRGDMMGPSKPPAPATAAKGYSVGGKPVTKRASKPASKPGPKLASKPGSKRSSVGSAVTESEYAEEGRKLLEAVNLHGEGAPSRYSPHDPLWRHPGTGAILYVGGQKTAMDREALRGLNVTRIVNCQDRDGKNYFRTDPELKYLKFEIGKWRDVRSAADGREGTWRYFEPVFRFVTESLAAGETVFVHCLAGAHRAGTCGIALLMYMNGWDSTTATTAAQRLRPAIMPIGGFPKLLAALDSAKVGTERRMPPVRSGESTGQPSPAPEAQTAADAGAAADGEAEGAS